MKSFSGVMKKKKYRYVWGGKRRDIVFVMCAQDPTNGDSYAICKIMI